MKITPIQKMQNPQRTSFSGTFNISKLNPFNKVLQKDIIMVSATIEGDAQIAKVLMEKGFAFEYSPKIIKGPQNTIEILPEKLSAEELRIIPKKKKN